MNTTALIDGDIFAYEAAASCEHAVHWGDGLWTVHAWEEEGKALIQSRIQELAHTIGATHTIVALSHPDNWRKDVLPSYKENREGTRKPLLLPILKDFITEQFETFIYPRLEADDVLGILATWPELQGRKVIVTKDKDLQTIPGLHYRVNKGTEVFEVSEEEADYAHLMQTITGDTTDGYKGCPGVGPVKAAKALAGIPPEERWSVIVKLYEKAGLSEEEALTQARVARICRASDYDFDKQEVILWTPKTL